MTNHLFGQFVRAFLILLLASTFTYVVDASAINIDDFTSNQSVSSHGGSPVNVNVSAPVVAIGGTRTFKTDLTQGTLDISLETKFGVLSHSQSAQVKGISTVTWDGDIDPGTLNSTGLPAINFFQDGGDAIVLDVLSADLPTEISVIAYDASDLTGGTFSKAKKALVPFSGLVNFSYLPALNDFTIVGPNGPADFTKIGALQIIIDGTVSQELDLSLESIKTNGICDLIPDPQGKVIDECGVCGGNNATCLGCDGIPNSGLMIDQCGVCGGDDTSCIGCDGELSSGLVLDECGVCGGDGTVCLDCAGEIFGTSIEDQCGVCGGDDLSCVSCNEVNIFETQAAMDALAKAQEFVTRAALKLLFSTGKATNKNFSKFISKTKGKVHELQINNWTLSWTLPSIQNVCENADKVCTSISNISALDTYYDQALQIKKLTLKTLKKAKKNGAEILHPGKVAAYNKSTKDTFAKAIEASHVVPQVSYACNF